MQIIFSNLKINKQTFVNVFSALLFYLFISIYITFPLIFNLGNLATGYGDEYLISWIMNWNIHQLFNNPFDLFNANIYYPYINTLAFSDTHLISSVLGILPFIITNQPIAIFNFTVISSIWLVGFFTFLLSFYITKNFWASIFSGILIIFSPAFLDKKIHVQMLAIQWVPISILFFIIFLKNLKTRYFIFSLIFLLIQFYNSFLPAYFIAFFYLIYLFWILINNKNKFRSLISKKNLFVLLTFFILMLPVAIPYYQVYKTYNAARDIRDAIHFANQPEDFIYPNNNTILEPILLKISNLITYENPVGIKSAYIGLIFSFLFIFGLIYFFKTFKKNEILFNTFFTTSIFGLILSLGPLLHFGRHTIHNPFPIVLPYAVFYYIIPGFKGFRNSERWDILFIFALAVFSAMLLNKILKKINNKKALLIYVFLICAVVVEFKYPIKYFSVVQKDNFPKSYKWLSKTPNDIVYITLPIYNWSSPNSYKEIERNYYSTLNFRKTINGYSGFSPREWQEDVLYLFANFPDEKTIAKIKKMNVNYLIINKNEYDDLFKNKYYLKGNGEYVISVLNKNTKVKLIEKFDNTYIYKFN